MIQKHEVQSLMRAVSGVVRDYVSKSIAGISSRLDEFDARIKAIPAGPQGERGADGKDAEPIPEKRIQDLMREVILRDLELNDSFIRSEVVRAVDRLPKAQDGRDGLDGVQGPVGPAGESITGTPGKNGIDGKDGRDGLDVDMVEVRAMVTEMFEGYPVPKDGAPGGVGRDGKDADPDLVRSMVAAAVADAVAKLPSPVPGAPGKDADPIHPDTLRLMVVEAVREEVRAIPTPKDGDPGQPGRDSLEIDILPSVDPAKSYPRGTFACYEGGLIRAIRNTEPIKESLFAAGWAVVIEGVSMFEVRQSEDLRSFSIRACRTSGTTETNEFRFPVLIYRGIFQEGMEYRRGDCVTWAGSAWHCEEESTKDKPGDGATDWRLMVKQGRPGKDADPKKP